MNILFDHQTFSLQDFGGISRYYAELIQGINKRDDDSAELPILFSDNVHLKETGIKTHSFLPGINFNKKRLVQYRINEIYTLSKMRLTDYSVFHATYYNPYFIPYLRKRPYVVTFLDMIHEKFSSQFPELSDGGKLTQQKKELAESADRIIAISESTKKDLVDFFSIDPNKISVVYLGSSFKTVSNHINDNKSQPYLLYVGRRERYKNFTGLLVAVHPLLKKYGIKLVCAGGDPFTPDEHSLLASLQVSSYVEYQPINDEKLEYLYRQAVAFVFPSLYEGFGIPVLEAFACNCPVVLSKTSSLPEVAGEGAVYFDPTSSESIMTAVEQVITSDETRARLVRNGSSQLAKFSWQRTVEETVSIYKEVL